MTTEVAPIRKSVVVDAPIDKAFALFVGRFDAIKPRDHNLLAVPIAETVFETQVGGHIYDVGTDGSTCRWARVLAYEPPGRVLFSWDIGPTWQVESDPGKTSEVEVRFVAESDARGMAASWWANELPDGSLLCCWFAGTYEGSADIHIICSLLPAGSGK